MLSIAAMGSGNSGGYYTELAREDYYFEGGEPPGQWYGLGATNLGLHGAVSKSELKNVLEGHSPDGKRRLVQNAGRKDRQPGWDLTFSAPKSVSTLWSQADAQTRAKIQRAQEDAAKAGLAYLEKHAAVTRRGHGGRVEESAGLIIALFEHGTSRALDPQLHTHCLFVNAATRTDGSTGTIQSWPLYVNKMTAGAIYRAELAYLLEHYLGVSTIRDEWRFKIDGVPEPLNREFSTRREEIEAVMASLGFESTQAAAVATLVSREVKGHVARGELFGKWKSIGVHLFPDEQIKEIRALRQERDLAVEVTATIESALEAVTRNQSHFTERDLTRRMAEEAQGRGLGAVQVENLIAHELTDSPRVITLRSVDGEQRYTTPEILKLEGSILASVDADRNRKSQQLEHRTVESALKKYPTASEEQKAAVRHITAEPGSVACIRGMAGTGKTFLLNMAREAWESEEYQVIGTAVAGKACQEVQDGASIDSDAIAMRLIQFSASDTKSSHLGWPELNQKTVLVIDEAGMVGTRQLAELFRHVEASGAKLVLIGDERQLQAIECGGMFKHISDRIGAVELTDIQRQKEEWQKQIVRDLAAGHADRALQSLAEHGCLTVAADQTEAARELVSGWKDTGLRSPDKALIFVGTNVDRTVINRLCQTARRDSGELKESCVRVGNQYLHEGDRVLFTQRSRQYGLENGFLGTITSINQFGRGALDSNLLVRLDSGRTVSFPLEDYSDITLGYAVTTHKGQGTTVDRAFVLLGGSMQDREMSYVQGSRAKLETRVYANRLEAGEQLEQLAKQMSRSRMQTSATEHLQAVSAQRVEQSSLSLSESF